MPALEDGQIIYAVKTSEFEPGEIAAFYYNNKILVKRIICGPGDCNIEKLDSLTEMWESALQSLPIEGTVVDGGDFGEGLHWELTQNDAGAYAREVPNKSEKGTITVEMEYGGKAVAGRILTAYRVGDRKEVVFAMADNIKKETRPNIHIGYHVGKLTVATPTDQRKNGYTIWRCQCDCGGEILLDTRCLQRGTIQDCGCETVVKPGQRDITGQRFGKLTVLYPTGAKGRGGSLIWHCKCDCGGEVDAPLHQLSSGYRKSCGCLSRPALKDYIGKRFGKLVVQKYAGKWEGLHRWLCLCDCGNETVVGQTALQNGKTKSCGCLGHPPAQDILGRQFGDLTVTAYDGNREGTYFWHCRCKCGKETVVRQNNLLLGHTKSCGCLQRAQIVNNLRLVDGTSVTILEAMKNRVIASNTSGYNGVYRNRKSGKWIAQITFKGRTYYLGSFVKIEDAVKVRKAAEERMYGEFLEWYYANHPVEITMPKLQ